MKTHNLKELFQFNKKNYLLKILNVKNVNNLPLHSPNVHLLHCNPRVIIKIMQISKIQLTNQAI